MTDRYSLGLRSRDRVDQAFGGGFPAGSVVLLEGGHGVGKSVLVQRFTHGMATEGTDVSYLSTEGGAADFLAQMDSLSYGAVDHLLEERVLFLSADLDTHEPGGEAAVGTRDLLSRLAAAETLWRADVIVIDGFDALLRNDPRFDAVAAAGDHAMQSFVGFLERAVGGSKTVILTVNDEGVADRDLRPLRDAADVYLRLDARTVGQNVRRSVTVTRFAEMRDPVDDTVGFAVQQGRGIVIENRTVA